MSVLMRREGEKEGGRGSDCFVYERGREFYEGKKGQESVFIREKEGMRAEGESGRQRWEEARTRGTIVFQGGRREGGARKWREGGRRVVYDR